MPAKPRQAGTYCKLASGTVLHQLGYPTLPRPTFKPGLDSGQGSPTAFSSTGTSAAARATKNNKSARRAMLRMPGALTLYESRTCWMP